MAQDEQLKLILEIRDLAIRQDERQASMVVKVDRIEKAIFGNGGPGIKARLEALEKDHKSMCPAVLTMADRVTEVERRHISEDAERNEGKQETKKEKDEFRKFKWGIASVFAATVIGILINLAVRFFGIQ